MTPAAPPSAAAVPMIFGGFFLIWLLFIFLIVALALAAKVFWIITLIDVVRRQFYEEHAKMMWLMIVIFGHAIGAVVYLCVGRQQGRLPS
jgi:hypothetical protein